MNVAHLFIYFDDEDDSVVAINSNFFSFFSPPFVHLDVRVLVQSARVRCRTRPPAQAVLNPSSPLLRPPSLSSREPVSSFSGDSVYAVSPPQVDRDTRAELEIHAMAGRGQVRVLCRDDVLMYREYVRNRYM